MFQAWVRNPQAELLRLETKNEIAPFETRAQFFQRDGRGNQRKDSLRLYGGYLCVSGVQQQPLERFLLFRFLRSKRTTIRLSRRPRPPQSRMLPRPSLTPRRPLAVSLRFRRYQKPLHFRVRKPRPKRPGIMALQGNLYPSSK